MNTINYKYYPFIPMLLILLYLTEGIFGLLSVSRMLFPVYVLAFFITYNKHTMFSKPVMLYAVSILMSIVSCYFFHGQSFFASFNSNLTFFALVIYFILVKLRIAPNQLERVLLYMFVIFCLCYIYQVMVYPKAVFVSENAAYNENLDASLRRIRIPGMSLAGFGFFFSLCKVLLKRYTYLPLLIMSMVVILLFGFRTLLAFSVLFAFVLNTRINGFSKQLFIGMIVILLGGWAFSMTEFGQSTFGQMMERQDSDQTFGNKDYIRYTTLWYYLYDHFESPMEYFFGSGIAFRGTANAYAHYYENLEAFGIHYYDWGILGMSWMMGVLSLVAMIWYPIKAFFTKLPKDKVYLGVWFGYLFACGFTSAEFVRQGCFLLQGMVLYLIYRYSNEENSYCK